MQNYQDTVPFIIHTDGTFDISILGRNNNEDNIFKFRRPHMAHMGSFMSVQLNDKAIEGVTTIFEQKSRGRNVILTFLIVQQDNVLNVLYEINIEYETRRYKP